MGINLDNFEENTARAVQVFWDARAAAAERQRLNGVIDQGERAGVTSGKNMDGFVTLIADLVAMNGLTNAQIYLTRGVTTLPGYFRPTKDWDLLVMHRGILVAAIELKSQIGPSFGNNFNNRTEEAIGSAVDLWTAFREGALGDQPRPFLGWLTHVEDAPGSTRPAHVSEPHFEVFPDHKNTSYLERYENLCRKLELENLYTKTALVISTRAGGVHGECGQMSEATNIRRFAAAFAAHIATESAMTS
ncbi:restriction endonuclease [Propionibacterium freudenreichii]|uniref:PaeR7I family type II restriction endonuclease n=1 Tax=Propionibacterium freudenreichii TaxID=1744 RepID=UPI0021A6F0DE|nr:PaeR7I family type II restriction endonuclease [Propionibacterium freudenreichii]MCT2977626.1 restriction endonuclease [Propionibacterium freudenreichii]MCT2985395.1 restriction endonuclease [Propionibacterium freudenreichii]MCT2986988.1 restriction endonuclease [Propionibacterium freudenreichii]